MNQNNLKALFTLLVLFASLSTTFCQEAKDTVYFDEDFSICEKPVAEYYRICTLNKTDKIFYKGEVKDYYIDGRLKMTGSYSNKGTRHGEFVFYNKNGSVAKKGKYSDDEMTGNWLYYDTSNNLKVVLKCNSFTDFTPITIINPRGDTLLKNGSGKFSFNTQNDLPGFFPETEDYYVQGEVENGLKNGSYFYITNFGNNVLRHSETYKKGKLLESQYETYFLGVSIYNKLLSLLHLQDEYLDRTSLLYHSNLIFGSGKESDMKTIDFLLNQSFLEIDAGARVFTDNNKIILSIINKVLNNSMDVSAHNVSTTSDPFSTLYYYNQYHVGENNIVRNISGDILLTIDPGGFIANSTFKTNLTAKEIEKINYYLAHVSNLIPAPSENESRPGALNFKLVTLADTSKSGTVYVKYVAYNADLLRKESLARYYPAVFPKFLNSDADWKNFLSKNVDLSLLAYHNAPNGSYTVAVSFFIDSLRNVSDVKAENDPGYGVAKDLIKTISKSPRWTPAMQHDKAVGYRKKQTLIFELSETATSIRFER